jgi:membrane protease YdiL (CAAX protease family)
MRLLAYFLLTFAVTWSLWIAAAAMAAPGNTGFFGVRGPIFLLGVFAPGLIALAFSAQAEGRAGVGRLLSRIGRWRVQARWYVLALSYFALVKLGAAVVHRVATGAWPAFGNTPVALMLAAIGISTWAQAGEEIGWRGYALPRLAQHIGLGGAAVVIGAVWAIWHLPLFVLPDSGSTGQSFPAYLLQVMALSVVLAYLYWKTDGSLLLVMVMHAAVNNTTGLVPSAVGGTVAPIALGASLVAWATVVLSWLVAAPLLVRMRGADVQRLLTASPSAPQ